jgi:ABC-type multidrug transport system fused ATPase/permease subunit
MFDEGKIVAEGSHKELYRKSEKYTEFYNLQEKEEPEGS